VTVLWRGIDSGTRHAGLGSSLLLLEEPCAVLDCAWWSGTSRACGAEQPGPASHLLRRLRF
jgi:hypothetical protein